MAEYIASIDQGTSSTRCIIFNFSGEIVSSHQLSINKYIQNPDGWNIILTKSGRALKMSSRKL